MTHWFDESVFHPTFGWNSYCENAAPSCVPVRVYLFRKTIPCVQITHGIVEILAYHPYGAPQRFPVLSVPSSAFIISSIKSPASLSTTPSISSSVNFSGVFPCAFAQALNPASGGSCKSERNLSFVCTPRSISRFSNQQI